MDCSKFEQQVSDYLDGLLAKSDAASFAAHSLQCRGCRALLDDVKSALKFCKDEPEVEAPFELESSLVKIASDYGPLACHQFQEIITEFLDGFVPASLYGKFEDHASSCIRCSDTLSEVVYAVAACHSVHTYEEYEVPEALVEKLCALSPVQRGLSKRLAAFATAVVSNILPGTTQSPNLSFATASLLTFATFAFLLFGFSDDNTVAGIIRQAQVRAGQIYSQGAEIYAQKDEVVAELQRVRSDIDEIWSTLGGETDENATNNQAQPEQKQ